MEPLTPSSDGENAFMDNYDIKQERRDLYSARRDRFEIVDVPRMSFLMVDGHGNPNTSADYRAVVEALYTTAYAVRAIAKKKVDRTHTVGPLEGLWSADDLSVFKTRDQDEWIWTLMIVQPGWVTSAMVDEAMDQVERTKNLSAGHRVRFDDYAEGQCVQTLHLGPYDQEAPTIARMHDEFMPAEKLVPRGHHHEIYLSDARRTAPNRLRTILRQPVGPAHP
ncbi:GyrI-like domain-containing protein [Streptomyces yokosukanensis]|uniref:GyrI-like domain-containing protein n=1 Tax=Streptomyces yokosukanensis TaxID=67386 RepID=UPI0034497C87